MEGFTLPIIESFQNIEDSIYKNIMALIGITYDSIKECFKCLHCEWEASNNISINHIVYEHSKNYKCEINKKIGINYKNSNYQKRLDSFNNPNWPKNLLNLIKKLAQAGFEYINVNDYVSCEECNITLNNWAITDFPIVEHAKMSPSCKFVEENMGSFAIFIVSRLSVSANIIYKPLEKFLPAKKLEYSTLKNRFDSFILAKKTMIFPQGQNIDILANAGFYYVGPNDNVKCFCCDGGLKNWRYDDNPWIEHKKWFPTCHFLKTKDSVKAIKRAQLQRDKIMSMDQGFNSADKLFIEQREIKAHMDSPYVQAVIRLGFSREIVKKVIETRLQYKGEDIFSVKDLVFNIFQLLDHQNDIQSDKNVYHQLNTKHIQEPSFTFENSNVNEEYIPSAGKNCDESMLSYKNSNSYGNVDPDSDYLAILDENRTLKEARMCKVCIDREVNVVFLPCGHLVCCEFCAPELRNCAMCRTLIRGTVKAFL